MGNRDAEIGAVLVGFDQGGSQCREQADLVVDCACIAQDGLFLADFGAAEHAADGAIE